MNLHARDVVRPAAFYRDAGFEETFRAPAAAEHPDGKPIRLLQRRS